MDIGAFLLGGHGPGNEIAEFRGIPFSVSRRDGCVQPVGLNKPDVDPGKSGGADEIELNEACAALFFLGMVTEKPEGSEWWGQSERYHYHGTRVFIGDRLGRINVIYADGTMETVPVIFGVNAWNYELFTERKDNEKHLNNYMWGPYEEPFRSDAAAAALLRDSLVLMENDAEKAMKYVFALRVRDKPVERIAFHREPYREAGFVVSAVTALKPGAAADPSWKLVGPDFFLRHEYLGAMDRLARRLYQFRDELPASLAPDIPAGYQGPCVKFSGNGIADLLTNIYAHNLHDMATGKIDEGGRPHTSSKLAPNFGCYVGFGTYRENVGAYYNHIWSRDVGRVLIELCECGGPERVRRAADVLQRYLYDGSEKYDRPHWKRIANAAEQDEGTRRFVDGKENDGHAAIMLFITSAFRHGILDEAWLQANRQALRDAAGWFLWQIENPALSNFDRALYSESEASTQVHGGYDLFSNACAYYALLGYERLADAMGDAELKDMCVNCASVLRQGILERFTGGHPRCGRIFTDTIDDCWTWEYKRFAPLFLMPDLLGYDPAAADAEFDAICRNTYLAQKEEYYSPAAGRQMGYGQGYLTETAILLDEYGDMTDCIEHAAMFSYHHADYRYIVPEGVIMHPSGRFWFRNSDLGNAVQQAEIVKCLRLLIGLDDNRPEAGLSLIPRLPDGWEAIEARGYPVMAMTRGGMKPVPVDFTYARAGKGYRIALDSPERIRLGRLRLGPFESGEGLRVDAGCRHEIVERAGRFFMSADVDGEAGCLRISASRA